MNTPSIYTWSDLTAWWECPRKWAYQRLGFRPIDLPNALVSGSMIHKGISDTLLHKRNISEALLVTTEQEGRLELAARTLIDRYIVKYGSTVAVDHADELIFFERGSLPGKAIGGHPDLLGFANNKRILVELKTGGSPDISSLDMTGQRDFYALVAEEAGLGHVDLTYLDIVSDEYITRIERPPRRASAEYSLSQLLELQTWNLKEALNAPRFSWHCRGCWYFKACSAREQGGSDRAVLDAQYVQTTDRNSAA